MIDCWNCKKTHVNTTETNKYFIGIIYHWISSISLLLPFSSQFLSTNTQTPNLILKANLLLVYNRRRCLIPMQTVSHRLKPIVIHIIRRYGWDRVCGSPNLSITSTCLLLFKRWTTIIFSQSPHISVIQSQLHNSLLSIPTISISPLFNLSLNCPSNETDAEHRLFADTSMRNTVLSGNNICRNDNVCGQIGVMRMPGVSGCTIDPPALME